MRSKMDGIEDEKAIEPHLNIQISAMPSGPDRVSMTKSYQSLRSRNTISKIQEEENEDEIDALRTPSNSPYAIRMTSLDKQGTIQSQASRKSLGRYASVLTMEEHVTKNGKLVIKDTPWSEMTHVCHIYISLFVHVFDCIPYIIYTIQIGVNVFVDKEIQGSHKQENKPLLKEKKLCVVYFKIGFTVEMLFELLKASKELGLSEDIEYELHKADEDGECYPNEPCLSHKDKLSDRGYYFNYCLKMHSDAMSTPTMTRTPSTPPKVNKKVSFDVNLAVSNNVSNGGYQNVSTRSPSRKEYNSRSENNIIGYDATNIGSMDNMGRSMSHTHTQTHTNTINTAQSMSGMSGSYYNNNRVNGRMRVQTLTMTEETLSHNQTTSSNIDEDLRTVTGKGCHCVIL